MGTDIVDLKGRVGLITGAGQGVGRAVALHFAGHNAGGVVVNDFRLERAEAVAAEVERLGCKAMAAQCDVTDFEAVTRMFKQAEAKFGAVDILVNNAGQMGPDPSLVSSKPFWEQEPKNWQPPLATNLFGVFNCVRVAGPGMIQRKYGRIITVVSDAGRVGEPDLIIYSGAKAGAAGFMRAVAKSLGRYLITANCVSLAATRTPTTEPWHVDEERLKRQLKAYVLRRVAEPEEPANMILFLSSDAASWITGQTIPVNGGYSFAL